MVDGSTQELRKWRGNDGKFEVDAAYVGIFQKTKVKLRKAGGAMIAVPLDHLCEEDVNYVKSRQSTPPAAGMATKGKEHAIFPGFLQFQPSSATTTIAGTLVHEPDQMEAVILTPLERGMPQKARPMRPESVQALSQLTLSSVTGRLLSAQAHWRPRPQTLAAFPPNILSNIAKYLDARTRVRLAIVSRSFFHAMFRPDAWENIWFLQQDLYRVDSLLIQAMTDTLRQHQLLHVVLTISLSGSAVTADSIVHLLVNFPELRRLSVKGCWEVHSFPLGGKLMHVAATWHHPPIKLEVFELGKALRRGVSKQELESKPNAPQSFGQDLSVISSALQQIAHHPVKMDCFICDFCHFGAAAAFVNCVACGPVKIHKCTTCAPRCDRYLG
ncbi:hypothetical protein BX666DRAFT_1862748 [Dichotomocladium elegans]|nr:hypothetical protein BX666DRAFT_1862748 [Dichotomocladium elegans]